MAEISQKRLRTDDAGLSSIVLSIAVEGGEAKMSLPLGAAPQSQFDKDRKFREALRSVADALSTYVGSNPALEAEARGKKAKGEKAAAEGGKRERKRERKKEKA